MSNKKPYIEERKVRAEKRLSTRLESLKAKGMDDTQIKRDPKYRQIQAEVRKAKMQLSNVEKEERQVAKQAKAKAKKLAGPKSDAPKKKKPAQAPAKKKAKKKQK